MASAPPPVPSLGTGGWRRALIERRLAGASHPPYRKVTSLPSGSASLTASSVTKLAAEPLGTKALGISPLVKIRPLGTRAFGARAFGARALAARALDVSPPRRGQ